MQEVQFLRKKWEMIMEEKTMRKNLNFAYLGVFVEEGGPIARIQIYFDNADALIENAPIGEERHVYEPSSSRRAYIRKGDSPNAPPTKRVKIIDLEHEK